MNQEETVLCGSSAYTKKYYLNPEFAGLPQGIQDELKIMCVMYTEDVGGALTLKFDEEGTLIFEASQEGSCSNHWKCMTGYFSSGNLGRSHNVINRRYRKHKYYTWGF